MQTTSLRKGENSALVTAPVVLSVAVEGLSADVSALLLGENGKVCGDSDLVFYNHPAQDGVSVSGAAATMHDGDTGFRCVATVENVGVREF
ncbi:TerD family protein [Streptomyces sp. NPDC058954]|uniref:TerD family protein n=1 Tax=Streptomyces sp. NPDC058954 TaxID=3346677 RepID=UPI00368CDE1C